MRKFFRRILPDHAAIRRQRLLGPLRHVLGDARLWHVNRRGVALGVSAGVFFGLLIPIAQIPFAAAAAIVMRANVAAAVLSTLVTNPFTFAPIYIIAYKLGAALLGEPVAPSAEEAAVAAVAEALPDVTGWFASLGRPLALGLAVLAVSGAVLAYLAAQLLWRGAAIVAMRRRRRRAPTGSGRR